MVEEQVVVFRLGKEEYALSISMVREIIQYQGATKLPNSPDYVKGIINLRGKLIPVIDIAVKFILDIEKVLNRRAIIIETEDKIFAIIVDEVTEVKKLQETEIEAVQNTVSGDNRYIRGVAKYGKRLIILLNAEKILESAPQGVIEEVSA